MMVRRLRVLTLALFALALVLAGPARAEIATHSLDEERWGSVYANEEAGKVLPNPLLPSGALTGFSSPEEEWTDPCGLIVNGSQFYIADFYNRTIDRFGWIEPEPGLVGVNWEKQVPEVPGEVMDPEHPEQGPCQIAFGTNGVFSGTDLYVNLWRGGVIAYRENAEGYFGNEPARTVLTKETTGIAIETVNPKNRTEDLLYANHRSYIGVYHQTGEPVMSGGEPLRIGDGSLGDGFGLARSTFPATNGLLYVADASDNTVKVYDPSVDLENPVQVIDGSDTPGGHFQHLEDAGIAVDNKTGQIFIADQKPGRSDNPPAVIYEYGRFGDYRGELPEPPEPLVSSAPTAIGFDEEMSPYNEYAGYIYVTTGFGGPGGVYAYKPSAPTKGLEVDFAGTGGGRITSFPEGIDCHADCGAEFAVGKLVTLTAAADIRSNFLGWKVEGGTSSCAGTGPCDVQLDEDTKVTAEFEQLPQKPLTVSKLGAGEGTVTSSPEGVDCGTTCSSTFNDGSTAILTATPAAHSTFTGWQVSGAPGACPGTGTCSVTMNAGQAVSATFAPIPQQTLSVSMGGNGSGSVVSDPTGIECGEFCSAEFDSGGIATLSAHPSPGSRFAGWSGGGCSGTGDCEVTVGAGSSVTANFARIEHTVTVGMTGAGAGAISSEPGGISCGGACSSRFLEGDVVNLTAVPATGSVFAGWSGPCTGRRRCSFVLAGDTTVRAEFRVAEWTLAVALGGEGLGTVDDPSAGIHCGLTCSGVYLHGTSITLVAKPSPGSFFDGWHGCDRPEGATCHATVDREETVGAIFSISPTILIGKVQNGEGGKAVTVTPSAPGTLSVRGKGLKRDTARASAAEEPVTLELDLSPAGRRALSKSRQGRHVIKTKITFTPRDGDPPVSKTISVLFKRER
jgi:hypothetical protein